MKLTIGKKLAIGFGSGIAALIIVSLLSYLSFNNIHRSTKENIKAREYRRAFVAARYAHNIWTHNIIVAILDPKEKITNVEFDSHTCDFGKWYYSENRREAEKFAPHISESLTKLEAPHNRLHDAGKKISELLDKGDSSGAAAIYVKEILPRNDEMAAIFDKMYDDVTRYVPSDKDIDRLDDISKLLVGIVGGIFSIGMIAFACYLSKHIKSILQSTIATLTTTSTQIAATLEEHERMATQQATSVSEISTTLTELESSSRQTADKADTASATVHEGITLSDKGKGTVEQTLAGMSKTRDKARVISEQILHLSEQTGQIGSIATLVSDIANQVNLLSLNASVEAVRAGEHGRGFSVVAVEIRKLADQARKSLERVDSLVADVQKATNSSVMAAEEGTKTIDEGVLLTENVSSVFNEITAAMKSIYENAQQVMLNAKQQSAAVSQVVAVMNSINGGAKETAAGISQTKIGVDKLKEMAINLREMV